MDFSGYSTDLVVAGRLGQVIRRFSVRLCERWPHYLMNGEESRSFDFIPESFDGASDGVESDIVTFSRDHLMEASWEESGYSLDASKEGPIGIFYKPFQGFSIQVDRGAELEGEVSWDGVIVAIPEGFHLSLVTPEDPSCDEFSRWVKDCLIQSLDDAPPIVSGRG